MKKTHVRVAVTGAAGQIGYALLFRLASGEVWGPDVEVHLQLLELQSALPSLEGVAMELEDCAFPLLASVTCTSDMREAFRDANWVILVGAVPRKKGMERSDLLKINGHVFSEQGRIINEVASSDVRILVVGNPCNTNALIAQHHALDIPPERFFAMTMLDQHRACAQLASRLKIPVSQVNNLAIWGNHSATQYPDFYHARIQNQSVVEAIADLPWLQNQWITTIQKRGAAIIEARGASSAASAAHSILKSIQHLCTETPQGQYYSMALCSEGQYGVDQGLIFSFPCYTTHNGQIRVVEGLEHTAWGQAKLQATLEELRCEYKAVVQLGLISAGSR